MRHSSSGSTLAISLVLLTSVTLGAVYAMQRTGVQLKLVSNMQHKLTVKDSVTTELQAGYRLFLDDREAMNSLSRVVDAEVIDEDGNAILDANNQLQYRSLPIFEDQLKRPGRHKHVSMESSIRLVGKRAFAPGSSIDRSVHYILSMSGSASDTTGNLTSAQEQRFTYDGPKF